MERCVFRYAYPLLKFNYHFPGVLSLYYNLFYHLESVRVLDPNNDLHLFCLHTVYIPRINRHLQAWKNAWVKHPIRSEHNFTPEQLWTHGLQRIAGSDNNIAKEVFGDIPEVRLMCTCNNYCVIVGGHIKGAAWQEF